MILGWKSFTGLSLSLACSLDSTLSPPRTRPIQLLSSHEMNQSPYRRCTTSRSSTGDGIHLPPPITWLISVPASVSIQVDPSRGKLLSRYEVPTVLSTVEIPQMMSPHGDHRGSRQNKDLARPSLRSFSLLSGSSSFSRLVLPQIPETKPIWTD